MVDVVRHVLLASGVRARHALRILREMGGLRGRLDAFADLRHLLEAGVAQRYRVGRDGSAPFALGACALSVGQAAEVKASASLHLRCLALVGHHHHVALPFVEGSGHWVDQLLLVVLLTLHSAALLLHQTRLVRGAVWRPIIRAWLQRRLGYVFNPQAARLEQVLSAGAVELVKLGTLLRLYVTVPLKLL